MLNRTNLTLSALSNRLNLGTRSLALNAGVNDGDQALRIRHLHHDVMRDRMVWSVVVPVPTGERDIPPIPGSILPVQQRCLIEAAARESSRPACPPFVVPAPGQPSFLGEDSLGQGSRGSRSMRPATARPGPARKRSPGRSLRTAGYEGSGPWYAARRAAAGLAPAAAITAAGTGG